MELLVRQLIGLNLSYLTVSNRLFVKALLQKLLVLPVEFLRALYWAPLLFVIFIIDLPNSIKLLVVCLQMTFCCTIKHDTEILQNDLLCLEHWQMVYGFQPYQMCCTNYHSQS